VAKLFLVFSLLLGQAFAQEKPFHFQSQIPTLGAKLKALKLEDDTRFEDQFNLLVKELEQTLEREKNICLGELSTESGEVVGKENRQVCLRTIKGHYIASLNEVHQLRKRYLTLIHQKQMKELDENYQKLKEQFDKSF